MELRFSREAWRKIEWAARKAAPNEISGFGISSEEDLLRVIDFRILPQVNSGTSTELTMGSYLDDCFQKGIEPYRCSRIWIHSHHTMGTTPSITDQETMAQSFGKCDWAIMVIVGWKDKKSMFAEAWLQLRPFPNKEPILVPLKPIQEEEVIIPKPEWQKEYEAAMSIKASALKRANKTKTDNLNNADWGVLPVGVKIKEFLSLVDKVGMTNAYPVGWGEYIVPSPKDGRVYINVKEGTVLFLDRDQTTSSSEDAWLCAKYLQAMEQVDLEIEARDMFPDDYRYNRVHEEYDYMAKKQAMWDDNKYY